MKTWNKKRKVRDEFLLRNKENERHTTDGEDVNIVEAASGDKCIEEMC